MLTKERATNTIGNDVSSTPYADCTAAYEADNTAWQSVDSIRKKIIFPALRIWQRGLAHSP